ncbi:hypothetical protein H6F46_06180 [Limnothrix sp. FACHB-1083]|uniref:hypothetical protein n=1 Tax=unclassified Limnothrix TaxID=2632864 RepID=UPI0016806FE6|nr:MULTISPECIES: hypothetical protein [unclassified Limnothrix]MBD2160280.1 hypothetical protein [Limnothrix sp. FACHB-1083]MBD2190983.1 hypothetical protein [Limnothrix sp. FACHB-1088]
MMLPSDPAGAIELAPPFDRSNRPRKRAHWIAIELAAQKEKGDQGDYSTIMKCPDPAPPSRLINHELGNQL